MRIIDAPEVLDLLDEIVQEFGQNHVYTKEEGEVSCLNWHNTEGKPGCIIGWLMRKLGASDDLLSRNTTGGAARLTVAISREMDLEFTAVAVYTMGTVQSYQDNGVTWGESVRLARKELGRRRSSRTLVGVIWP